MNTQRTQLVYRAVLQHWRENGYSPTVREVAHMASISSTSVTKYHLNKLREQGDLDFDDDVSRSITIPFVRQHVSLLIWRSL